MSEPIVRMFNNPILIAQARRRLRPAQLVSSALICGLLGICGVLLSMVAKDRQDGFSSLEYALLAGVGLVLLLRGSNRVAEAVREERESGLLDFHRATPTTPWTDGLGYLLGCPAREYLIAGILAAFALACAPMSKFGLPAIAGALLVLTVNALLYHCFALWVGLSVAHRRGASGIVIGTLICLLLGGGSIRGLGAVTFFTPYPAISELLASPERATGPVSFYGFPIHVLVLTLAVQGSLLFALGHGVVRKLRQDDAASFSRLGTLYLFGWIAFLSLGAVWQFIVPGGSGQGLASNQRESDIVILVGYLALSTVMAAALVIGQVPSYLTLLRSLRRARRQGTSELSWLDDGGRCEPLTLGMWVLIIAGLFVIHRAMGSRVVGTLVGEPVAAVIASVLAYLLFVQGASEYVRFRHRGATQAVAVFVFFASHILPWLLSFVFGGASSKTGLMVMAISPIYAVWSSAMHLGSGWLVEAATVTDAEFRPLSIYVSLAVTLAASAFFFVESRRCQRSLATQIAKSAKSP